MAFNLQNLKYNIKMKSRLIITIVFLSVLFIGVAFFTMPRGAVRRVSSVNNEVDSILPPIDQSATGGNVIIDKLMGLKVKTPTPFHLDVVPGKGAELCTRCQPTSQYVSNSGVRLIIQKLYRNPKSYQLVQDTQSQYMVNEGYATSSIERYLQDSAEWGNRQTAYWNMQLPEFVNTIINKLKTGVTVKYINNADRRVYLLSLSSSADIESLTEYGIITPPLPVVLTLLENNDLQKYLFLWTGSEEEMHMIINSVESV